MIIFMSFYSIAVMSFFVFFFNDTATTEIYTLSLHDALPIYVPAYNDISVGESSPMEPSMDSQGLLCI